MSEPAPAGAMCALHSTASATFLCGRCGAFMCAECERRTRPEAHPMCPTCWELRSRVAAAEPQKKGSGTALQTAGLVLGCFALLPVPALQVASLILNLFGIVTAREPRARAVRWRPIVGLSLTGLGLVGTILIFGSALR